jgi:hypothetical protein
MSDLVSKVLAGGVSAGIFLLWWPAHVSADGPEWLVVRGLLWTLALEILALCFIPLERAITAGVRDRGLRALAPRPLVRALALATAGLAVPATLVGATGGHLGAPVASAAKPPKVIVKREIVRREVVVRRVSKVVRVPVATAAAPAPAATRVHTQRATTTPKARTTPQAGQETKVVPTPKAKADPTTTTAPAAKTTTAAPTATAPAATTSPAPTAAAPASTSAAATGPVAGN